MQSIRSPPAVRQSITGPKPWTNFCLNAIDCPAVGRIYDHFGWSLSREAEQCMRVLVTSHAQSQSRNHRYHLSQFGSSAEQVLGAFASYCQRFGACLDGEKLSPSHQDGLFPEAQRRSDFVSFTGKNAEAGG